MKTKKQKGFTLVELVIVIAVIAILAAVLIPTFSNLIKKANLSADEQAVKQMNTALAIYTAENGKPETAAEVKKGLSENDINTDTMTPVTKGYAFYWDKENNKIVLVGEGKGTAENTWSLLTTNGYGKEASVSDVSELNEAITNSTPEMPSLVTLNSDLTITQKISISEDQSAVIDLNGKTVTCGNEESKTDQCLYVDKGCLTVENGSFLGNGRIVENHEGSITLKNLTITVGDNENTTPIRIDGISDTTIIDCKITAKGNYALGTNSNKDESDGARISISNSEFVSENGTALMINIYANVTIEKSSFIGAKNGGWFRGCNATIKDSTFEYTDSSSLDTNWKASGNSGKRCALLLASGGNAASGFGGYVSSGNYICENITAQTIYAHQPDGGKVTITGIDNIKWDYGNTGSTPIA